MNPANKEQETEHRIERVLAALRHAEPTPGMEGRISAALSLAVEAPVVSRWWALSRLPQLAGLAAIVAVAVLLSAHVKRKNAAASAKDHVALRLPTEGIVEKAAGFSPLNSAPTHGGPQPRAAFTGAKASAQTRRVSGLKSAAFSGNAKATPVGTYGLRTRETTRAAQQPQPEQGFPAPPLPLTPQERLLVRLVHRDNPLQLAQLTPAAREAELQRDREQVREFFKPPPMPAANFTLEPYPITGATQ